MSIVFLDDDNRLSWGRVVHARHQIARPRFIDELAPALAQAVASGHSALPVGLGRSYGDSNLNPGGALIDLRGVDRIIAFDAATGVLRIEAGASLGDILRFCVPQGWFLPTTPGTRFVTVGGAIANDVHGKNHQSAGSFGRFVRRAGLIRSDRGLFELGPDLEPDMFAATVGGLGLTGVIAWAEIQLVAIPSAFIDQEVVPFGGLDEFFALAEESRDRFEHTVAWIDCMAWGEHLGRGLFTRGVWSKDGDLAPHEARLKLSVPIDGAALAFNPVSLAAFNTLYRLAPRLKPASRRVHYSAHLYPLDAIGSWNRLYGANGFYQYQCVVPPNGGRQAIGALLQTISDARVGSPLVVLKTFGPKPSPGLLSFPTPGVTLAMDFCNKGEETLRLFARLDDIVRAAGGRLYPAKDGRVPAAMFQHGYPQWERFAKMLDPALSSAFWRRVSQ